MGVEKEIAIEEEDVDRGPGLGAGDAVTGEGEAKAPLVEATEATEIKEKGILNPFKMYSRKNQEKVDIKLVKNTSHELLTYTMPLEDDFDRNKYMTEERRRQF